MDSKRNQPLRHLARVTRLLAPLALLLVALPGEAQAFEDDELEAILRGEDPQPTAAVEAEAMRRDRGDTSREAPEERPAMRPIRTLQQKTFLKIGRWEASPHVGFVTNDPFINRYFIGASGTYHVTEVFGVELMGSFSPDFGEGDWKPITHQLVNENRVSPDISKISWWLNANFQYSPIYGKIAVTGRHIINFDMFATFGTGIVQTNDDLKALFAEGQPSAMATEVQIHPTTNFGGGFRIIFSENLAARVEGRSLMYIETVDSTTLEMKNNFLMMFTASFFFPGM